MIRWDEIRTTGVTCNNETRRRANVGKAANDGAIISITGHENYDDCVFATIIKTGNDIDKKDDSSDRAFGSN